ncbi:unnamed protein product [Urochloa humidicola]
MAPRRNDADALAASPTVALAILVFLAFCARSASAVGSTPHSAFSYKDSDPDGPSKWATLQKDWALCDSGTEQNRGHDFMLNWKEGNGKLTLNGKEYTLLQVHWHAPSEHTVNGTRFDTEMHMVHEDAAKEKAVVSVFFSTKAGKPSKLLGDLQPYFKKLTGKQNGTEEVKDPVDPATMIDKASGYYRYEGSLTTPPCTEGVIWTILSKVADASVEQINALKSEEKTEEPNSRPTQKINSRVIRYYEGGDK